MKQRCFTRILSLSRLIINLDLEKSPPSFISSQRASRTSILNFSAVSRPTIPYLEILRRYYATRAKFVATTGQTPAVFRWWRVARGNTFLFAEIITQLSPFTTQRHIGMEDASRVPRKFHLSHSPFLPLFPCVHMAWQPFHQA